MQELVHVDPQLKSLVEVGRFKSTSPHMVHDSTHDFKYPKDSYQEIVFPFSQKSQQLNQFYSDKWGQIRLGLVFEWLDILAGVISLTHVFGRSHPLIEFLVRKICTKHVSLSVMDSNYPNHYTFLHQEQDAVKKSQFPSKFDGLSNFKLQSTSSTIFYPIPIEACCYTAGVQSMKIYGHNGLGSNDISISRDIKLSGQVVMTGRTSLQVDMKMSSIGGQNCNFNEKTDFSSSNVDLSNPKASNANFELKKKDDDESVLLEASFIMVVRDNNNNPLKVPACIPLTDEDRERQRKVMETRQIQERRKSLAGIDLKLTSTSMDDPQSSKFGTSKKYSKKSNLEEANEKVGCNPEGADALPNVSNTINSTLNYKSIVAKSAKKGHMSIEESKRSSTFITHPEVANIYSITFGGYLMNMAYEQAWCHMYSMCNGMRPTCVGCYEFNFFEPIPIATLVKFEFTILYNDCIDLNYRSVGSNEMDSRPASFHRFLVQVKALAFDPVLNYQKQCDVFHFIFKWQVKIESDLLVEPRNDKELVKWLEGKRILREFEH